LDRSNADLAQSHTMIVAESSYHDVTKIGTMIDHMR